MRIFIDDHGSAAEETVRLAVHTLREAGIHSAGGGAINDRAVILVEATDVPKAVAVLSQARMRAIIG